MVEFLRDPTQSTWTEAGQGRKINLDLITMTITITVVYDALGSPDRKISADLGA